MGLVFKKDPHRGVCIKRIKPASSAEKFAEILINSAVISIEGKTRQIHESMGVKIHNTKNVSRTNQKLFGK